MELFFVENDQTPFFLVSTNLRNFFSLSNKIGFIN